MERITALVREKLRREALSLSSDTFSQENPILQQRCPTSSSTHANINTNVQNSSSVGSMVLRPATELDSTAGGHRGPHTYRCWLCAQRAEFSLEEKKELVLCFTCFRAAFCALVLPRINTPQRRESDARFIEKIRELKEHEARMLKTTTASPNSNSNENSSIKKHGSNSSCSGNDSRTSLDEDTVEVTSPSQASFVMRCSVSRRPSSWRGEVKIGQMPTNRNSGNRLDSNEGNVGGVVDFWTCPRCTFVSPSSNPLCGACGLPTIGVVYCPYCSIKCRIEDERLTKCPVVGRLHILWCCRACQTVQALDADRCSACRSPLLWVCEQCTMVQTSVSRSDGLRCCCECGAYATPMQVIRSPPDIDSSITSIITNTGKREGAAMARAQLPTHTPYTTPVEEFGVNDAVTLAEMSRQQALAQADARLRQRMQQLDVTHVNAQLSDGNCLFRALASQLFSRPAAHATVRALVVTYMREHAESYRVLFDGREEWVSYLQKMRQNGCWGDELCLNAAARCFHVNIHVITSEASRWHLVFQHDALETSHDMPAPPHTQAQTQAQKTRQQDGTEQGRRKEASGGILSLTRSTAVSYQPPVSNFQQQQQQQQRQQQQQQQRQQEEEQSGVCLFLVYTAPVHYDDVQLPQATKAVDLRGTLKRELLKLVEDERDWCDIREELKTVSPSRECLQQQFATSLACRWSGGRITRGESDTPEGREQHQQELQLQQQPRLTSLPRRRVLPGSAAHVWQ